MPTLQVISREQDPGQKQMLDASNQIADTLYKSQSLKQTAQYYKILAQNAQTEQDKAKNDRLSTVTKQLVDIQNTQDPSTKSMLIKALHDSGIYQGDSNQMFHDISDAGKTAQNFYSQMPEVQAQQKQQAAQQAQDPLMQMKADPGTATPQQVAGANVADLQSQARLRNIQGKFLEGASGAASGAGGYQPGDINVQGMNFINPAAEQAKAGATATGTELAKKAVAHQQFTRDFEDFKAIANQVPRSNGGLLNRAGQGVSNTFAALNQSTPQGQMLAAYDAASKRFATTLARQVDVGNLSETEQQAASKMIPDVNDSAGTARIKMAFIEDMNRAIGSNDPSKIKGIIDKYQGATNTRANIVGGVAVATPKGTTDYSKLSDDDLRKIIAGGK